MSADVVPIDRAAPLPDWLRQYAERGFRLVFYDAKSKGPRTQARIWTPDEYRDGQNVGVMLGNELEPGGSS